MRNLTAFLKKLQLKKILTAFLIGTVLLVTTACNSGNEVGARPDNPPVQMGGQNNPHKAGGDGYTQYKAPTAPMVKEAGKRSQLTRPAGKLVAAVDDVRNSPGGVLYPGSGNLKSADSKDDFFTAKEQKELSNPAQFPETKQQIINRNDPDAKLLEKAGQSFKDASNFLTDSTKNVKNN
jgi:hypothetical protein